jgi:hypothetical protein
MHTPEEYRERAAECELLAQEAVRAHDREAMLYTAKRWRDLANEEEARRKFDRRG